MGKGWHETEYGAPVDDRGQDAEPKIVRGTGKWFETPYGKPIADYSGSKRPPVYQGVFGKKP